MIGHPNLKAWLPMDEVTTDFSGVSTLNSNTNSYGTGIFGQTCQFGANTLTLYNAIASHPATIGHFSKVTISFILWLSSMPNNSWCDIGGVNTRLSGADLFGWEMYLYKNPSGLCQIRFYIQAGNVSGAWTDVFLGSTSPPPTGGITIPDSSHIVITRTGAGGGASTKLYLNEVEITDKYTNANGTTGDVTSGSQITYLGNDPSGYGTISGVKIDSFLVYSNICCDLTDIRRLGVGLHPLTRS